MTLRVAALGLTIAVIAGCGASETVSPVTTLEIWTQSPPPPGEVACMTALLEGRLALDVRSGLGVAIEDGDPFPVHWPSGWTAVVGPPTRLLDEQGRVVATLGDHVRLGGGVGAGPNEEWYVCPTDVTVG
jgi:hypothetical protein